MTDDDAAGGRWRVVERVVSATPAQRLERDVRRGLADTPPWLPARWFYDERGSLLFDEITRLPEYYPTRRETEILRAHAADIADLTKASTLVELGAGTSTKTRLLLDALTALHPDLLVVPLDVSIEVLADAARTLARDYPSIRVEAVAGDFDDPLEPLPGAPGSRLIAFLGGTIGNFDGPGRAAFLDRLRTAMDPGDHLLLGADLVKDEQRLVAAYDDSAGVTAAFNLNLIDVLRRELDATGLDPADFRHVARWNAADSRIEMWLHAQRDIDAWFRRLDLRWQLAAGGGLRTEISVKFELATLHGELAAHGLHLAQSWTDPAGDFSLTLAAAR